jgi:multidrug resistance efflux pump
MLKLSKTNIDQYIGTERFYTLEALGTPRGARILAKLLLGLMLLFIVILFLPWQQNIRGAGKVTAFNPQNRPQSVEAVIAGRIQKWHVQEGQFVDRGDTIVTISEVKEKFFDPQLLPRLREQIQAKENGLESKEEKIEALNRQVAALRNGMQLKIEQARAKLDAERVRFENAKNQYERNKNLFEAGNIALTKFQDIEYKFQGSQADFLNAQTELDRLRAEFLDKINKSESEISSTYGELFDAQAEISKMRNELANFSIRNEQYQILAPQSGFIVKAIQSGIGETIKEGDAVCTIMPETTDVAVEMYVRAMDVPLMARGEKVRIEFDGWPALQFSGWPSVSVGTFGGEVQVIDYVNSKPGEFRILVVPDSADEPWPKQLRQGSGIKGWIMLNDVPIWYEIWRQLNGFPPSLYDEPLEDVIHRKQQGRDSNEDETTIDSK